MTAKVVRPAILSYRADRLIYLQTAYRHLGSLGSQGSLDSLSSPAIQPPQLLPQTPLHLTRLPLA